MSAGRPLQIPVAPDGTWEYQVPVEQALLFGGRTLEARQVDAAGNLSAPALAGFMILVWSWDDLLAEVASFDEQMERFETWDDVTRNTEKVT